MRALGTALFLLVLAGAGSARAFAGFYVSRARGRPRVDSSQIVLMRDGDRAVVSVRHDYRGPAADAALVLPVPASVGRDAVRTLRPDAFDRIERLSAPRLVEFWERDPCGVRPDRRDGGGARRRDRTTRPPPATVEARFAAAEHDVAILRARRAAGLTRWLRERGYRVPPGAEEAARPYVERGYRFLVAQLEASRLIFEGDRARPSPLRFHYRTDEVVLPVGLARLGAAAPQDLIVQVLARGQRYEVANRANVLVPTNLVMYGRARERFDAVYATILERVLSRHPGAMVTEYAWPAASCAPCPAAALGPTDLETFGRDAPGPTPSPDGWVLTRLHARLDGAVGSDLVLRPAAAPIAGGSGGPYGPGGFARRIDRRVRTNAFQARYAILHGWDRPVGCPSPRRGRWGAPPRLRRPAPLVARPTRATIPLGRLRRFLHTWAPVLRIPARGDAPAATLRPRRRARR